MAWWCRHVPIADAPPTKKKKTLCWSAPVAPQYSAVAIRSLYKAEVVDKTPAHLSELEKLRQVQWLLTPDAQATVDAFVQRLSREAVGPRRALKDGTPVQQESEGSGASSSKDGAIVKRASVQGVSRSNKNAASVEKRSALLSVLLAQRAK